MTRAVLLALVFAFACAPAAQAWDLPLELPGEATASSVRADPDTWIVGARPGRASAAIAARFSTRHFGLPQTGGYTVRRSQARAFAAALKRRHLLVYAQANVYRKLSSVPNDPLSGPPNDWRAQVVSAAQPPPVTPQSPLIALVDVAADAKHIEWTGDPNFSALPGTPVTSPHGTATAAVASAPQNGIGILGVWPGARTLNVPLPTVPGTDNEVSCDETGDAIAKAVESGASVINMSYSSPSRCAADWVQIYFAVAKGIIPVAAAGNDFESGNPLEFPASLPHVVTVAATTRQNRSASFSNANAAVDLSAPGVGILTAVPPAYDTDRAKDGYQALSGTSFSAPMVSAAMAWVRAARPQLSWDRVVQAVRLSATDVVNPDGINRPGWDPLTGFGVLNVGAALAMPVSKLPVQDPLEPNDNVSWVDGRAFGKQALAVWSGVKATQINGRVEKEEDPIDVYRVVIPAHGTVGLTLTPRSGDPTLEVFKKGAVSVHDVVARVAYSHRAGAKKTERATVTNPHSSRRSFFVAIKRQGGSRYRDSQYSLRMR